jgi:hypothetical protein
VLPFRPLHYALLIAFAALPSVTRAQEQSVYDVSIRALANRRELMALVDSIQREISRPGTSARKRRLLQTDLEVQRQRLSTGDVAPGDRILLRVLSEALRQDSVTSRPDTVIVSAESTVQVRGLEPISMRGVLRSDVEQYLRDQITAVIRNARVTAVPLVSIGVLGSVTRPGYFFVPITSSVTEAIMASGGPLVDADPNGIVFQRGGRNRWNRATMAAAQQQQVSLAALGTANGDVLLITKAPSPLDRTTALGIVGAIMQGVLIVTQLGRN